MSSERITVSVDVGGEKADAREHIPEQGASVAPVGGGSVDVIGEKADARKQILEQSADELAALRAFFKDKCDLRSIDATRLAEAFVLDYELYSVKRLQAAHADGTLQGVLKGIGVDSQIALAVNKELAVMAETEKAPKNTVAAIREQSALSIASENNDSVNKFVLRPKDVGDLLLALSNGSITDVNVRCPSWHDVTCLIHQCHFGKVKINLVFFLLTHDPPADPDILSLPRIVTSLGCTIPVSALFEAVMSPFFSLDLVKMLLRFGADRNMALGDKGETVLTYLQALRESEREKASLMARSQESGSGKSRFSRPDHTDELIDVLTNFYPRLDPRW